MHYFCNRITNTLSLMKQILLLLAAAAIVPSTVAEMKVPQFINGKKDRKTPATMRVRQLEAAEIIFRSLTDKVFIPSLDGEGWELSDCHKLTYDATGRVLTDETASYEEGEIMGYTRETRTYSEGFPNYATRTVISSEDGSEWENNQKVERTFDSRLTDVVTANRDYQWYNEEWALMGNNYNREITRDANGNITNVTIAVLFQGVYDPTMKLDIEYGEDGKAKTIRETTLTYDSNGLVWEEGTYLTDIVWDRTNGQIYNTDELFIGENRIKSCRVRVDGDIMGDLTADYSGNWDSYHVTVVATDDTGERMDALVDHVDYGNGFNTFSRTTYSGGEETESHTTEVGELYDHFGLLTHSIYKEDDEIISQTQGIVTYEEEHGNPDTYEIQELDPDSGEFVPATRIEYSDYVDVAGVEGIASDNADAPAEYYDLRGVRIARPTQSGIYIRRQGADVTKILVK